MSPAELRKCHLCTLSTAVLLQVKYFKRLENSVTKYRKLVDKERAGMCQWSHSTHHYHD